MDWSEVKPWLVKLVPMLGTALGGPVGGVATALLTQALGGKDATPDSIQKILTNGTLTGDQLAALKQAELNFSLQMKALDIKSVQDLEALAVDDRKSARERQIAVKDQTPQILAYLALGVWGAMNGILLFMAYRGLSLPVDMSPVIMRVLGTMDALMGMAFAFFFGTSAGSRAKDALLFNSKPASEKD